MIQMSGFGTQAFRFHLGTPAPFVCELSRSATIPLSDTGLVSFVSFGDRKFMLPTGTPIQFRVVGSFKSPQLAAGDQIVAVPTLVRHLPPPLGATFYFPCGRAPVAKEQKIAGKEAM